MACLAYRIPFVPRYLNLFYSTFVCWYKGITNCDLIPQDSEPRPPNMDWFSMSVYYFYLTTPFIHSKAFINKTKLHFWISLKSHWWCYSCYLIFTTFQARGAQRKQQGRGAHVATEPAVTWFVPCRVIASPPQQPARCPAPRRPCRVSASPPQQPAPRPLKAVLQRNHQKKIDSDDDWAACHHDPLHDRTTVSRNVSWRAWLRRKVRTYTFSAGF